MFDEFVAFRARLRPQATAVLLGVQPVSYAEFDADVDRVSAGLRELGLEPASGIVAIQITDPYRQLLLLAALARLRVASAPGGDACADLRLNDEAGEGAPPLLQLSDGWFADVLAGPAVRVVSPVVDPESIGRVLMSSGTTRTPRRIGLTWRMIDDIVRNAATTWCAGRQGCWIPITSIDSIMGLTIVIAAWAMGAAVAVGWPKADLPAQLEALQPSLMGFTPAYLRQLLQLTPQGFRPQPGLRLMIGGAALPRRLAREARERLTPDIQVIYGATECSAMAHGDSALLAEIPGATGYAGPGVRLEIVDAAGVPVPTGEAGEIRIVCDRAARRYIGDSEASAAAFRDGAFHPGDVGRLMADGLLVMEGRVDDRINFGGFKIMPIAIEEVALACPGVEDAAAFGAPDAAGLDECWLAVVQGEGFSRERLAAHMADAGEDLPLVRFAWIPEIPRNVAGKVDRGRLRAEAIEVLGRPSDA